MDYYLDSCVVVSAFISDANSSSAESWLKSVGTEKLVASDWTVTEIPSGIGRLVRTEVFSTEQGNDVWRHMTTWLEDRCNIENVTRLDMRFAANFQSVWHVGLRAGDALHLAIARRLNCQLITFDKMLAKACTHFDVPFFLLQN
jgi:uncharacterized protein